jgi:hypothetical protein
MRTNTLMPIMIFMTRYYHSSSLTGRQGSATRYPFRFFQLALFALGTLIVTSCEEAPIKLGKNFLPGTDFISIESDTLNPWSYTMYDDSVRTDNPLVTFLGEIFDPYFGRTTAELVSQVRMGSAWDPVKVTIDSVKLFIRFQDVKGSGKDQILNISEIDKQIYTDSAYYSNTPVPVTGYSVAVHLPDLKPDTINDLAILVDTSFAKLILADTTKLFYNKTQADFRSYIKGFYFQLTSISEPTLVSMSLASPSSSDSYKGYFVIYIHKFSNPDQKKELLLILDAVNRNAAFNKYNHYFNEATLDNMEVRIHNGHKDTLSFLQYLDGVYTKISLPGLKSLKDSLSSENFAINKARLTVPVYYDGYTYKSSTVPKTLLLRYRTNSGTKFNVPDYYLDNNRAFFSGLLDTIANVYTFNIPSFVEKYLKDATNSIEPEVELYQSSGARNVILRANSNKTPVKFNFTYTKF